MIFWGMINAMSDPTEEPVTGQDDPETDEQPAFPDPEEIPST